MSITRFTKQPNDALDYDIDFTDWFGEESTDTIVSYTTPTVDPGLTLDSDEQAGYIVKVWLSGGTTGNSYKVTTIITTAEGREKEREIMIKVKEI